MCRVFSIVLLVSILSFSQVSPWEWQHPLPHGNHINDVVYLPSGKIMTFCNGGAISHTTNAGLTWNTVYADSQYRDIYEADFVSESVGFAAGTSGLLMKTTNGGGTWQLLPGFTQTFWYIDFLDADTGYAVGSASALLKTTDGGATWNPLTLGVTTTIYRIFFISPSTGYLGTSTAANRLYKTTDYGATWTNITANVPFTATSTIRGIFFSDMNNGWLTTTLYEVYKTSNAGQSWVLQNDFGTGTLYDIKFVDSLKGITVGTTGQYFTTTDGGTNWTAKQADTLTNLYGMAFKGNNAFSALSWNEFVLCGMNGVAYLTNDAGATLNPLFRNLSRQDLRKVQFLDSNTGFAAGGAAVTGGYAELFKTQNGGAEWTKLTLATGYRAYSQWWTNATTGFFGTQGVNGIFKTTDGGATITQLTVGGSGSSSIWYDIAFANDNLGFACGSSGNLFRTTDGGTTWASASSIFGTSAIYDICVVNATTVFVAGTTGRVIKSTDGGVTWTSLTTGTTSTLYGVSFLDENNGYFCGASGRLHKTTDGGATWTQLTTNVTATLYSVQFINPMIGAAGGSSGTLLLTTDGGATWVKSAAPFGTAITTYDIAAKGGKLWAAGTAATIISASVNAASISVSAPSSGISITAGSQYNIQWSATGVSNVTIELSTDGGTAYTMIAQNLPASPGNYLWTVPNIAAAQCKIRVKDAANANVFGLSTGFFAISSDICRDLNLSGGWNMLSVPVKSASMIPSALFPTANSQPFGFNGGYVIADTFKLGYGYWLRFPAPVTRTICGLPSPVMTIPVTAGWNLIGMYHQQSIPVTGITSTPPGIITSGYFGYNNGYLQMQDLTFGKAYWVRASQAGVLNIPAIEKSGTVQSVPQPNAAITLTMRDAAGKAVRLYLLHGTETAAYDLPPLPPAGIFDVRFAGNSLASSVLTGGLVLLQGARYPVTLSVSGGDIRYSASGLGSSVTVRNGSSVTLSDESAAQINIEAAQLPVEYSLGQNFPNPFNPVTSIQYSIPESGAVSLKVYSVLGKEVAGLVNEVQQAGSHTVTFSGAELPSGTYFYELRAGSFSEVKKFVLLK